MSLFSSAPTEAQLEILQVLWDNQPCSVRFIHEAISEHREIGYTTILKQIQRMQDEGRLRRKPGPGKSYLYEATEAASETRKHVLDRVVKNAFGDSMSELMLHALGNGKITDQEIAKIKELIQKLDNE
ncbi:MAG: BlaI/MecI/CopY family transcriptional regulator [Bacteroidota bacterium]